MEHTEYTDCSTPHIRREWERAERLARLEEYEEAFRIEEEEKAERLAEDAYCERAMASYRAGEPEDVFEQREAAALEAKNRITDRLNSDIARIFAIAVTPGRIAA
jgi:hypothetical protein